MSESTDRNATLAISNLPTHKAPPRHKPTMRAYPDYSKSLATQRHAHPIAAGLARASGTGTAGAVLGALIARLISDKPNNVIAGAVGGGVAGAVPGFISGAREAESNYSKMLFLRRKLGINEPGELDVMLQSPTLVPGVTEKKAFYPASMWSKMRPGAKAALKGLGVLGVAGAGYELGSEGMSRAMGYHSDDVAKHFGGGISAANLGTLAALYATRGKHGMGELFHVHPMLPASMIGAEMMPTGIRAVRDVAHSQHEQAQNAIAPTLTRLIDSPAGHGAGIGAGLAGLASIVTGLSRPRSESEIASNRGRGAMVTGDFLKYVLPAMVGGGVVGSTVHRNE